MNFNLAKFDSSKPIYIQIIESIKKKIISEEITQGDKLPSVRELSGILKVNINTIQKVYKELEREGITLTQRGMGTFVTENINIINCLKDEMASKVTDNFMKDMRDMGYNIDDILEVIKRRR